MTSLSEFKRVLGRYQHDYPVETVPIAHALGLKVYKARGLPDNISGRIYRVNGGYAIDVNAMHGERRRRFTIAHEIAHYVLHREQIGEEMFDDYLYRSGLSNSMEWEANAMAADILMPRHLIRRARARGIHTIPDLARAFNVSESAMSIRMGAPA